MTGTNDEELRRQWRSVRAAVLDLLAGLPDDLAQVSEDIEGEMLSIEPSRPEAPEIWMSNSNRHEISCSVAETGFSIWGRGR